MWGEKERWQGSSLGPLCLYPGPFQSKFNGTCSTQKAEPGPAFPSLDLSEGNSKRLQCCFTSTSLMHSGLNCDNADVPVASVAGEEDDRTPGWRMLATTIVQPAWALRSPGLLCSCCQNMKNCFSSYKANCTFAVYIFLVQKTYSKCWHMLCWSFHTNCCTLLCSWWAALSRCCLICYTSAALTARKPARLAAFSYFWGWFRQ